MADIRSVPEEDSGVERTLKTILLGDFYKNPSFSGLAVRATISVVPGLDQLADVQDTAAWVLLCRDEGFDNPEVRLTGLLLGIGWIPVIGSVGKPVLKALTSSSTGKSVAKLLDYLNFLGKGNGIKWLREFSGDLPALAKQAASKMKAILDELHSQLGKLKELVPQKLTQKLDEWRSAVMRVRNQIDEMFAKAADDLKAQLDEALARFNKQELDVPSGTKTEVKRVQDSAPPPRSLTTSSLESCLEPYDLRLTSTPFPKEDRVELYDKFGYGRAGVRSMDVEETFGSNVKQHLGEGSNGEAWLVGEGSQQFVVKQRKKPIANYADKTVELSEEMRAQGFPVVKTSRLEGHPDVVISELGAGKSFYDLPEEVQQVASEQAEAMGRAAKAKCPHLSIDHEADNFLFSDDGKIISWIDPGPVVF